MATKNRPGEFDCYAAADPDEPLFVLRSTDTLAPMLVREWVLLYQQKKGDLTPEQSRKVKEALQVARDMEEWKLEHPDA